MKHLSPSFSFFFYCRQLSNFDAPGGGHMPHNGWDEFSPPMQPPHGLGSHTDAKDGIAPTSATGVSSMLFFVWSFILST